MARLCLVSPFFEVFQKSGAQFRYRQELSEYYISIYEHPARVAPLSWDFCRPDGQFTFSNFKKEVILGVRSLSSRYYEGCALEYFEQLWNKGPALGCVHILQERF